MEQNTSDSGMHYIYVSGLYEDGQGGPCSLMITRFRWERIRAALRALAERAKLPVERDTSMQKGLGAPV
jgi:hypothetical protein